jgi:uncharacterized C2H2 Zn-finger protein
MITRKGYVRVYYAPEKRLKMMHRIVWEEANGKIPPGLEIHHKDKNKQNNKLENLQMVDRVTHKRLDSGCEMRDGEWWKRCGKCMEMKPTKTEYYWHLKTGWLQNICKSCRIKIATSNKKKRRERAVLQHI